MEPDPVGLPLTFLEGALVVLLFIVSGAFCAVVRQLGREKVEHERRRQVLLTTLRDCDLELERLARRQRSRRWGREKIRRR